ncbi:MAG: methionine adenosyltransferase [Alphaproteobacteria bacterium]|nr:methionine adenosyltransferase [Alphaproteobacteria bacterium]
MISDFIFTSDSVSEGHPDKICDQISDAILDAYLREDPTSRTAIETVVMPNRIIVFGKAKGPSTLTRKHIDEIVRERIRNIGYDSPTFDWRTVAIETDLKTQPLEDSEKGEEDRVASAQGVMFGYACLENEALMPTPLYLAQTLMRHLAEDRKKGLLPQLRPDGKCQFSVKYRDNQPVSVTTIVISVQHREDVNEEDVKALIWPYVEKLIPEGLLNEHTSFFVNPTGRFVIGGPERNTGLTGRKIIVDTYGGMAPHGGGAFSGKDPTKIDRSGAYMARYIAKNVVAAGLSKRCTLQLSYYAIGKTDPTSFYINTHGTGLVADDRLAHVLRDMLDLTPRGIQEKLALNRPIYTRTAAYGHFGRKVEADGGFSWEKTDLSEALKGAFL